MGMSWVYKRAALACTVTSVIFVNIAESKHASIPPSIYPTAGVQQCRTNTNTT